MLHINAILDTFHSKSRDGGGGKNKREQNRTTDNERDQETIIENKRQQETKLDAGYPESPRQRYFDILISQSKGTFYTTQLLQQNTFTPGTIDNFFTRHLWHQTTLQQTITPGTLLHTTPFRPDTFTHQTSFTPDHFLQQNTFTPGTLHNFYTRHLWHQATFTTNDFYTRHPFTQDTF